MLLLIVMRLLTVSDRLLIIISHPNLNVVVAKENLVSLMFWRDIYSINFWGIKKNQLFCNKSEFFF